MTPQFIPNGIMVTIRCATYNHEPYIRQCLEGFVMQKTNFLFEAVVHDDASTDKTADIIREFATKYPEIIKPIYQTENQYSKHDGSLTRIMNAHTRGKYIALCEGDDYWTDPLKLQKQVDLLEADRSLIAVVTNASVSDSEGNVVQKEQLVIPPKNIEGRYNLHNYFKNEHHYPTLTVLFKSAEMEKIREDMHRIYNPFFGDKALWIILHTMGDFYFLNEVTGNYRRHPTSVTRTIHTAENMLKRSKADFRIRKQIIDYLPKEYHKYLKNNWNAYLRLALSYRKMNKPIVMLCYLVLSFFAHPIRFIKELKKMKNNHKIMKKIKKSWN